MIEIDGAEGEGGGQILRTAVALSALTQHEVRVFNIRANRPTPGLAAQHLCAIQGVRDLCQGALEGGRVGSTELTFRPGPMVGGRHRLDVGTAGSITLVLQACVLAACRSQEMVRLEITGGTNVRWSPPIDFLQGVLFPLLSRLGLEVRTGKMIRGFYPEGGGSVEVELIPATRLRPLTLTDRGELQSIEGVCFSQNLPEHICRRMGGAVRQAFLGQRVDVRAESARGASTGAGCFLLARFEGAVLSGDALGERGMPAERVGESSAQALQLEMRSRATLDLHAADQLLPYLALAEGPSSFIVREMSGHLRTQIDLVERFLPVKVSLTSLDVGQRVEVSPQPYM
jgi:RNA 3'-terminal phosphate cyclase (ATP)